LPQGILVSPIEILVLVLVLVLVVLVVVECMGGRGRRGGMGRNSIAVAVPR
jgi:hypothetical protein